MAVAHLYSFHLDQITYSDTYYIMILWTVAQKGFSKNKIQKFDTTSWTRLHFSIIVTLSKKNLCSEVWNDEAMWNSVKNELLLHKLVKIQLERKAASQIINCVFWKICIQVYFFFFLVKTKSEYPFFGELKNVDGVLLTGESLLLLPSFLIRCTPRWCHWTTRVETPIRKFLFIRGLQDLKWAHEGLVDRHHGPSVVELSAVVGRGE